LISGESVMMIINNSTTSEEGVNILLNTLPYVYPKLTKENPSFVEKVVKNLESFTKGDLRKDTILKNNYKTYLGNLLQTNLNCLKQNESSYKFVFTEISLKKEKINISDNLKLNFKNVKRLPDYKELFEEANYNVLNKTNQFYLSEHIEDVVVAFKPKINLCLDFLDNLNNFFGTEGDINYLIIEVIVNQILRLNNEAHDLTYFTMLLAKLAYRNKSFKELLNDTIQNKIIMNIAGSDIESIENTAAFLSLYVSSNEFNFDYKSLNLLNLSSKPKETYFIKLLIDKLTILGTKDTIRSLLDSNLHHYLPEDNTAKKK
jgi:hypothetical protein